MKRILINNHATPANKDKIKGQLGLEHIIGFGKTWKKLTKNLGFHITIKSANLQNITLNTLATDINITINSFYHYIPVLIPATHTQVMFNESSMNIYTITFDSWYIERKNSHDGGELQVDIGSAQHVNSPKYLITAFQTTDRIGVPNKANNIAVFDTNHVTNYFVEIDGSRYPRDGILANLEESSYLDQYRDLKFFYKEYVGNNYLTPIYLILIRRNSTLFN